MSEKNTVTVNFIYNLHSVENERGRQEQLARERIAARKKKREEALKQQKEEEKSEAEKLEAEEKEDEKDDLSTVEQIQREGTIALQDGVLNELEKKHVTEQEVNFLNFLFQNGRLYLLSIH